MEPVETRNLEVMDLLCVCVCVSVFSKVYGLRFSIHFPPSDVFLLYLGTSFQKQMHIHMVYLGLSRCPSRSTHSQMRGMARWKHLSSFMYWSTLHLDLYVCKKKKRTKKKVSLVCLFHIEGGLKSERGSREKERNHEGGKTGRWENSMGKTEGRKKRRIIREEESDDETKRGGRSFDVPFPTASAEQEHGGDECVCPSALNKSHSEADETHCYCLPDENSQGKIDFSLSSSSDAFVSLETKVCWKDNGMASCEDECVGSHQATIRRVQRWLQVISVKYSSSLNILFIPSCQSPTLWKWLIQAVPACLLSFFFFLCCWISFFF